MQAQCNPTVIELFHKVKQPASLLKGAKAQTTLCREMATRFHNGGAQMKRGARNSRATRQWPQNGGEGPHPRVDFNKMKVTGFHRADLPALSMGLCSRRSLDNC